MTRQRACTTRRIRTSAYRLQLHEIFYGEAFTVAGIVEEIKKKTFDPGTHSSEPTPHAAALKAALPEFLAEAVDRDGFFQKRTGKAFAARADRRFGNSGVHLKRGTVLTGRQQWEVAIPEFITREHPPVG
jgi:hypothetical protein